ncbi:MAG: dTDP-glucose 4,6-dehydratase [SAR324 cluster bacterium]|nr:dTDP-glucose 4,6-dehydratase [SAR324 cluster bacterium]
MKIMITGGAGFIGSNLILSWLENHPEDILVNFDCLTYAGNLANLKEIENHSNYHFYKGDLRLPKDIEAAFEKYQIEAVIHLAAESHVDRSILTPDQFIQTNIVGTFNLLETAKHFWQTELSKHRFLHVSTDEVYGSLGESGYFQETTPYRPNSPYSASKAGSDHLVRAYYHTYGMNTIITNCSNNYGPYQFPEKLIPLLIKNCMEQKPIPVYGNGSNIRDWLYVKDHCCAIDLAFHKASAGETYNIGGLNEWKNIDIVRYICRYLDEKLNRSGDNSCQQLITFVKDRPGHDQRYAIDASKIQQTLSWQPEFSFEIGIQETINWYLDHQAWVAQVTSGEYQKYYIQQYEKR